MRLRFHVEHLRFERSPVGLRNQLRPRPGILEVLTDPASSVATVSFDPRVLGGRDIEGLIAQCGYHCHCCDEASTPVR